MAFTTSARSVLALALLAGVSACGGAGESPTATTAEVPSPSAAPPAPAAPSPKGAPLPAPPAPRPPTSSGGAADAGASEAAAPSAPEPAPCPTAAALAPGDERPLTLRHGGATRSYVAHVGRGVKQGRAAALVVNFHGLNNSPSLQATFSGMDRLADDEGFVVVYPQGQNASFNAGGCCGRSSQDGVDDLGFTRALVADISTKVCVDRRRVYATGFSNGGFMSYRVACEAADLFAAIAPVAGANASPSCAPSRSVPVLAFHGRADSIVPYDDGKAAVDAWVARARCDATPTRTTVGASYCEAWSGCEGGIEVKLCSLAGWNHLWPAGGAAIAASPAIWEFFQRFSL